MKKNSAILLVAMLALAVSCSKPNLPPAPYDHDSYLKIMNSLQKTNFNDFYNTDMDNYEQFKGLVRFINIIYSKAGYDFEKSAMVVMEDIVNNPELIKLQHSSKVAKSYEFTRQYIKLLLNQKKLITDAQKKAYSREFWILLDRVENNPLLAD